jgi:hypothetical protein
MDELLQNVLGKALDQAHYRINLFNIKENIKIKTESIMTHAANGGVFKADRNLISFVKAVIDHGYTTVVLIDINGNPIEITDVKGFYAEIFSKYFEATNYYHIEYTKLKRARTTVDQFSLILSEKNE